jgi:hypothetical protein
MDAIPILSLMVALAAVFVGPILSTRSAKRAMLGPMRQKWINTLRDYLSDISSLCIKYWQTDLDEREKIDFQNINDLKHKIIFMINPNEDDHEMLISLIAQMIEALSRGKAGDVDFHLAYKELQEQGRKVLKREWEVVKNT